MDARLRSSCGRVRVEHQQSKYLLTFLAEIECIQGNLFFSSCFECLGTTFLPFLVIEWQTNTVNFNFQANIQNVVWSSLAEWTFEAGGGATHRPGILVKTEAQQI